MMRFERQTVDGQDLRIARVHNGDRPTVVMTNAFPQSIRCWESLWERLADNVDLLAVDLPGFGRSTGSGSVMRPSAQSDVLLKLLDVNGIDQIFLIGPDIGVPVSLWLASSRPERLLGLNIYDGPGTWPSDFGPALKAATRSRLVRWFGSRPPMRRMLMKQNFNAATAAGYHHFTPSADAVEEYRTICFDPEKHRNAFDFLGSYAAELPVLEKRLPSVSIPVLITWGAHDQFVRTSNAERLHDLLPNSELTVFDGAGHFSHEDADDEWLQRFLVFVETHHPRNLRT
ncbi:alpha/beta fold hydrolase [Rhodococcus spongiicola]|uniref:Alpha/beta hydrolase n=1 Tax=Rhodococcus spongiicola TaxID=2487352 RepID=A0A438B4X9_9NOCA|nr:alpha/beta hydrolase [Rhodococcus spongiicola]RVW06053.1 alpha/beta hydrolase [Rhodococcus spongiicola]